MIFLLIIKIINQSSNFTGLCNLEKKLETTSNTEFIWFGSDGSILKGLDAQVNVMGINIFDCLVSIAFIYFLVPNSSCKRLHLRRRISLQSTFLSTH